MATITTPFIAFKKEYILQFDTTSEIRGVIDDTKKEVLRLGGCLEELSDKVNHLANSFSYMGKQIRQTNREIQETLGLLNKLAGTEYSIKIHTNTTISSDENVNGLLQPGLINNNTKTDVSKTSLLQPSLINNTKTDVSKNSLNQVNSVIQGMGSIVAGAPQLAVPAAILSLIMTGYEISTKEERNQVELFVQGIVDQFSTLQSYYGEGNNPNLRGDLSPEELENEQYLDQQLASYNNYMVGLQDTMHRGIRHAVLSGKGSKALESLDVDDNVKARVNELAEEFQAAKNEIERLQVQSVRTGANLNEKISEQQEKMRFISMQADGIGQDEFLYSDEYQRRVDQEQQLFKDLINNRELQESYRNYAYEMQVLVENSIKMGIDKALKYEPYGGSIFDQTPITDSEGRVIGYKETRKSNAFGMAYVPYDNFPALLHQGERVLTASQARTADGQARRREGVVVNIGDVYGNTKNDAYDIARILVSEITRACEVMV